MKYVRIALAYVPVLHEGYRRFLEEHANVEFFGVFGESIVGAHTSLHKDIRGLSPLLVAQAINAWGIVPKVFVVEEKDITGLDLSGVSIVMPDEDVSRVVAEEYLKNAKIKFDSVFLRWHTDNILRERDPVPIGQSISFALLHNEMLFRATAEAKKSSDWWRHIGAVATRDGDILLGAYNKHVPSPHLPYAFGDPRMFFKRGEMIHLSTAIHAERCLIAHAARRGIKLEGADLYVTTFPCPSCAKQIAEAGFRRCFYRSGYAMLDGDTALRQRGVEIIRVEEDPDSLSL